MLFCVVCLTCVCSLSDPSTVRYRKHVDALTLPAHWDAIGPEVRHVYEVHYYAPPPYGGRIMH